MENRDIEKLLNESVEDVKVKDFSDRWEKLKARIDSVQTVKLNETTSETVLATSVDTNISQNTVRNRIIISACSVFLLIVLCLAIVLPLTLKNNDKMYFELNELTPVTVTEKEFYDILYETDLKIVNLEKFEVDSYALLYTTDNKLVGGRFDVSNEEILATLVFYNTSVKSSFDIGTDHKTCSINGFNIKYKTEPDADEFYSTKAQAVSKNICYEFECLSLDENIETFFEKIFG